MLGDFSHISDTYLILSMSACLSPYLSICLSIHLSIYIYSFIYSFMSFFILLLVFFSLVLLSMHLIDWFLHLCIVFFIISTTISSSFLLNFVYFIFYVVTAREGEQCLTAMRHIFTIYVHNFFFLFFFFFLFNSHVSPSFHLWQSQFPNIIFQIILLYKDIS